MRCLVLTGSFLVLFSCSCGNDSTNEAPDSVRDPVSEVIDSANTDTLTLEQAFVKDTFFLDSFLVLIDSFFTDYSGLDVELRDARELLTTRDTSFQSRKYIIKPVNGSYAWWHLIDAGETSSMQFQLAEVCYPDSVSCDQGWNEFVRLSGHDFRSVEDGLTDDGFPCLSYGSDLAFRTGNKIFWLCTFCNWDYGKHQVIAALLKRTIYQCETMKEIRCKCGDVVPRNN